MKGKVKRWVRSYGFIGCEEYDEDLFVHNSDIQDRTFLEEGETVEFEVEHTQKGLRAVKVKPVSE